MAMERTRKSAQRFIKVVEAMKDWPEDHNLFDVAGNSLKLSEARDIAHMFQLVEDHATDERDHQDRDLNLYDRDLPDATYYPPC